MVDKQVCVRGAYMPSWPRSPAKSSPVSATSPTLSDIDALLRFLPGFERPGRAFIASWGGGEETGDGAITMPYPIYDEDVLAFFMLAGKPCWSDYGYVPERARQMLQDDALVARASLDQIATMLTYCVRGERFGDGHWAAMLESGRIVALLRRLAVIRESLA